MNFHEVVRNRRSVRGYKPDPVPEDVLRRVFDAVRLAPTAVNRQPFHFIVVTDPQVRARMKSAYDRAWFFTAPVIVVGCVEPQKAWRRRDGWSSADVDLAIAFDHLILAATAEGLGSCWVCAFDEARLKELLGIPEPIRPVALTPLGYPNVAPGPLERKPLEEMLRREHW